MRSKNLWFSLTPLLLIHLVVLGACCVAPYDPAEQRRDFPFAPPMRVHFVDLQGRFHLRPYVCPLDNQRKGFGPPFYVEDCSHIWPLRFLVRSTSSATGANWGIWHLFGVGAANQVFLLGTDDYGRDVLSRLLHGGQISLFAGLLATGLSLGLGLLLGGVAGYFGSWLDDTIMRGAEIFMALPWIYLLFAIRSFLPLHLGARQTFFVLVVVIGFTGWSRPARLIRGVVLSVKERDFVLAARGFGASGIYILRHHLLPETFAVVLTQAALLIPHCILAEVTLSFLGLGVGEPVASWGNMLASLQKYYVLERYWWMLLPGIVLVPIFLLYYTLANALLAHGKAHGWAGMTNSFSNHKVPVTL
jgi:peptide/nickel transport system permease protein